MKKQVLSPKHILILMFALLVMNGVITDAIGWEVRHTYTASGNNQANFTPTYSGNHYTYAKGPTNGNALAQFQKDGQWYARIVANSNQTMCGQAYLNADSLYRYESTALVHSGTAICIGYDKNASGQTKLLCPLDPAQ